MQVQNSAESSPNSFHRFQVFVGTELNGAVAKMKSVGMAYAKEGQNTITLRLWTFLNERFYLVVSKVDPSKYLIMTREPNKNPSSKKKYFWNIVGNGLVDSKNGVMRLEFDLFDRPVYMNLHPEVSASSANLPEPDFVREVA